MDPIAAAPKRQGPVLRGRAAKGMFRYVILSAPSIVDTILDPP
jgi:hypothetical protein